MILILPIFMLVVSLVMLIFALIGLAMRQKFQWVYVPIGLVGTAYGALEILRTVHSFDPCIACAVHTIDPAGSELTRVEVG